MSEDKRIYPRSDVEFDLLVRESSKGEFEKTTGLDISATGLSFLSGHIYPVGTEVELKLVLEEIHQSIPVKAKIVRNWSENDRHFSSVEVTEASEDDFVTMLDYSLAYLQE